MGTFFVRDSGSRLEPALRRVLEGLGWEEKGRDSPWCVSPSLDPARAKNPICRRGDRDFLPVDFYWVGGVAAFKSMLSDDTRGSRLVSWTTGPGRDVLTRKGRLAEWVVEREPTLRRFFLPTYRYNTKRGGYPHDLPAPVCVLKAEWGFAGDGLYFVRSAAEAGDIMRRHAAEFQTWVIQPYMTNPSLLEGKKYHTRTFILATSDGRVWVEREGRAVVAKRKFVLDDWRNPDIHDTHARHSAMRDDLFLNLVPGQATPPAIAYAARRIISGLKLEAPRGCARAVEIFGMDTLTNADGRTFILEINLKPTLLDNRAAWFRALAGDLARIAAGGKPETLFG